MKKRLLTLTLLLLCVASAAWATNDPGFDRQWGLQKVGAPEAWQFSTGQGAIVAVVDTGVDLDHEDFTGQLVGGFNVTRDERGAPPNDDNGHGTHVAGIVAAKANNALGIAGIAHGAKIMPIRALKKYADCDSACGYTEDIVEGIKWAVNHGAKVVNLSLGEDVALRTLFGSSIEEGLDYAWARGAIPVVAAGNDNVGLLVPSGYSGVDAIIVGSIDRDDRQSSFSNDVGDAKWGMVAPGRGILSTWQSNQYAEASGTSMATPHVAAGAAILFSQGLSQRAVVDRLLATATNVGSETQSGSGRLNLASAVIRPQSAPPPATGTNPTQRPSSSAPKPAGGSASRGGGSLNPGNPSSDPETPRIEGAADLSQDTSPSKPSDEKVKSIASAAREDSKPASSKVGLTFGLLVGLSALAAGGFAFAKFAANKR